MLIPSLTKEVTLQPQMANKCDVLFKPLEAKFYIEQAGRKSLPEEEI
jgi:hypothetical protein